MPTGLLFTEPQTHFVPYLLLVFHSFIYSSLFLKNCAHWKVCKTFPFVIIKTGSFNQCFKYIDDFPNGRFFLTFGIFYDFLNWPWNMQKERHFKITSRGDRVKAITCLFLKKILAFWFEDAVRAFFYSEKLFLV